MGVVPPAVGDPARLGDDAEMFREPLPADLRLSEERFAVDHVHIGHNEHAGREREPLRLRQGAHSFAPLRTAAEIFAHQNHLFDGEAVVRLRFEDLQRAVDDRHRLLEIFVIILEIEHVVMKRADYVNGGRFHFFSRT